MARIKIKSKRKAYRATRAADANTLIDQINFLAEAQKLESKARFTKDQKNELLEQLKRQGASYDMLFKFSMAMNTEKNYEAIIFMLRKRTTFTGCDSQLILDAAEAFIRDVGEK